MSQNLLDQNEVLYFPGGEGVVDLRHNQEDEVIETTAIGMAREALNLQKSHERICDLRWSNHYHIMNEVRDSMKDMNKKFWTIALGLIGVLLTCCGTLIVIFVLRK